ncbi:hypothetical protein [Longispora urticae]
MNLVLVLSSSALVSALVSAAATFFTQDRLARRKARIDYENHAHLRLYEAIGPLRFQLLLAARDAASRIADHPGHDWEMDPAAYYGHSFLYRLLRPLTITHLIERQLAVADFSVDRAAIDLIRFGIELPRALSGGAVTLGHPDVDWSTQRLHLFRGTIDAAADRLIVEEAGARARPMTYPEFTAAVGDPGADPALQPIAALFSGCRLNLTESPLWWLRVVAFGYACHVFVARHGPALGVEPREFPVRRLLEATPDPVVLGRIDRYLEVLRGRFG